MAGADHADPVNGETALHLACALSTRLAKQLIAGGAACQMIPFCRML
jgi:hypothetical protein